MLSGFKFFVRLMPLASALVISACVSVRPMPKVTKGLTNPAKGEVQAVNSSGTEFKFRFDAKNKDGSYMFDKWICAPGDQFIDMASWIQELLVVMKQGAKR